jgi:hypothetical protein
VAKIVGWDIATGELAPGKNWDLSDIFLYDNKGSDRVSGVHNLTKFPNGEPDPNGLTTCCHHGSVIARFDFDGNVRWLNRNGDYYGDLVEYNQDDGTFGDLIYGHTETPGFKYHVFVQVGMDVVLHGGVGQHQLRVHAGGGRLGSVLLPTQAHPADVAHALHCGG